MQDITGVKGRSGRQHRRPGAPAGAERCRRGDQTQAVARVPPSQIVCLPPRSGQFRDPT